MADTRVSMVHTRYLIHEAPSTRPRCARARGIATRVDGDARGNETRGRARWGARARDARARAWAIARGTTGDGGAAEF